MNNASDVAALQRLVGRLRQRISFIEGSRFWKVREGFVHARAALGISPKIDPPAIPAMEFSEAMDPLDPYTRWLLENDPRAADLVRMREVAGALQIAPSVAIVVDDRAGDVTITAESVLAQAYGSVDLVRTSVVSAAAHDFERFNEALASCVADYVAFCSPGWVLAPHACFEVAVGVNAVPDAVAVYGDRDVLIADGARCEPTFAPDWSPEAFLSAMYTGPVIFYRRDAVMRAGGFRAGCGAALHYDLALRVLDDSARVVHRPAVLVHEVRSAVAPHTADRTDIDRVVNEALERRGDPGHVVATECRDVRIVRYVTPAADRIEVVVPTRDLAPKLERCVRSVYAQTGCDVSITVVDNGSVEPETASLFRTYERLEPNRFRVIRMDEPFNFSRLVNAAVRSSEAPFVLLLNNDAAFVTGDGIVAMVEQARRPGIGAVGARLLYEDGTLQHAGVVVGIGGLAGHVYRGADSSRAARDPAIAGIRNRSAVTAACMMVRRDVFEAAGGFDERLAVEFNDVDFCLKLMALGLRNVYLPHVMLLHDESSTRGRGYGATTSGVRERELFRERWRSDTFRDPYYNANLTLEREDASIAP